MASGLESYTGLRYGRTRSHPTGTSKDPRLESSYEKLRRRLGKGNTERLRILRRAASELASTFSSKSDLGHRPVPLAELRSCLQRLGIERGDSILVHSAMGSLIRGGSEPAPAGFRVPEFANAVLELLMELVGPEGSILMPTAPPTPNYELALRGIVFDPEKDGVGTGLLPDLLRRHPDAIRTRYPCQNVTVWGGHAKELVAEQYEATPYPMNEHSAWTKQCRMGGKVILLGVHHDRSSTVHLVENLYPEEYPRPVFFQKPHRFRYMDAGKFGEVETFLHAVHWEDPDINSFGDYIGTHYGIYRSDMAGRVPVLVYRSADQLEAFRKEMLNDVSMFDSRFWDRRR